MLLLLLHEPAYLAKRLYIFPKKRRCAYLCCFAERAAKRLPNPAVLFMPHSPAVTSQEEDAEGFAACQEHRGLGFIRGTETFRRGPYGVLGNALPEGNVASTHQLLPSHGSIRRRAGIIPCAFKRDAHQSQTEPRNSPFPLPPPSPPSLLFPLKFSELESGLRLTQICSRLHGYRAG